MAGIIARIIAALGRLVWTKGPGVVRRAIAYVNANKARVWVFFTRNGQSIAKTIEFILRQIGG
ncbi:hypothetical protein LG314_11910 [Agrococcus terreus]|uniref:hypothetical protein n=1 Tax=Agrococcus terreus TaxID=574649 RepID=UPI00384C0ACA